MPSGNKVNSFIFICDDRKYFGNSFIFISDEFICDDRQTDKQTNTQTHRINSLYVVELIATRAEWQQAYMLSFTNIRAFTYNFDFNNSDF